jgi:hypothetical protein
MIVPSKFTSIEQSALKKSIALLQSHNVKTTIIELFEKTSSEFESIDEFILSIETLWILGKLFIDFDSGEITYAT